MQFFAKFPQKYAIFSIFCSLTLIFPHFLRIFPSFLGNILILCLNLVEVWEFRKQRVNRDSGKIRIFRKNIHPCAEDEFTDSLQTEKLELSCLKHRTLTWRLDRLGDSRDTRVRCGGGSGHQQGC